MQIRDAALWAAIVDANPLPAGCPSDPDGWARWWLGAGPAARAQLYGAVVVLAAHRWADAMEAWIDTTHNPTPSTGLVVGALACTLQELRPFALTDQQIGAALAMLLTVWQHGAGVRAVLEVAALEATLVGTGPPS